jgi:hypothetical protein
MVNYELPNKMSIHVPANLLQSKEYLEVLIQPMDLLESTIIAT